MKLEDHHYFLNLGTPEGRTQLIKDLKEAFKDEIEESNATDE